MVNYLFPKCIDGRHPIEQDYEEEVKVCESMKLLKEVLGQKSEDGVLGGPDIVVCVSGVGVAARRRVLRDGVVGNHRPLSWTRSGHSVLF